MAARALRQRTEVSLNAVQARASEFPGLSQLLGERIGALAERAAHRDTAPRLLALFGETGRNTHALLRHLERTVEFFDARDIRRWEEARTRLATANQPHHFLSAVAELVLARWLHEQGLPVVEFEPEAAGGKRPDLLVRCQGAEVFIEVASPGPQKDAIESVNSRLHVELERVESGLVVDVSGYDWDASRPETYERAVTRAQVDAVVREFRRKAAGLDRSRLPAELVVPGPGQPVAITAIASNPEGPDYTFVRMTSSEKGFVPNVDRLVRVIRDERRQLPDNAPGLVLMDLSRWSDFRNAGYYLQQAADELTKHTMPVLVGAFFWQGERFVPEDRLVLHADTAWKRTAAGQVFMGTWA